MPCGSRRSPARVARCSTPIRRRPRWCSVRRCRCGAAGPWRSSRSSRSPRPRSPISCSAWRRSRIGSMPICAPAGQGQSWSVKSRAWCASTPVAGRQRRRLRAVGAARARGPPACPRARHRSSCAVCSGRSDDRQPLGGSTAIGRRLHRFQRVRVRVSRDGRAGDRRWTHDVAKPTTGDVVDLGPPPGPCTLAFDTDIPGEVVGALAWDGSRLWLGSDFGIELEYAGNGYPWLATDERILMGVFEQPSPPRSIPRTPPPRKRSCSISAPASGSVRRSRVKR